MKKTLLSSLIIGAMLSMNAYAENLPAKTPTPTANAAASTRDNARAALPHRFKKAFIVFSYRPYRREKAVRQTHNNSP